ncbi:MAG: ABC transporter ATP-binding protein [Mycobacteriales bacterium]
MARPVPKGSAVITKTAIKVEALSKTYGRGAAAVHALQDISFEVAAGDFVSIVGPSGCGKTTLLQCMSGLLSPTGGTVSVFGTEVTKPIEDLALVFQDYSRSLFPWLTADGNVRFPLRSRGLSKSEVRDRSRESLVAVGLEGYEQLYPWQMSGGMQQRVAIARGIALRPRVLLMDEPFASVDAQTRCDLEDLTLKLWAEIGVTVLFVTHDIDEAVYVSNRVVVLSLPPTLVDSEMLISLSRPRDQVSTKEGPEFGHLRADLFRRVMGLREAKRTTDAPLTA